MNLSEAFGPRSDISPHEDLDAHLRRGNVALLVVPHGALTRPSSFFLGAIRKVPAEGPKAEQWNIMPLADVTTRGEEGAFLRAAMLATCAGRDRFEVVMTDKEMVPVRMVTVLASAVEGA